MSESEIRAGGWRIEMGHDGADPWFVADPDQQRWGEDRTGLWTSRAQMVELARKILEREGAVVLTREEYRAALENAHNAGRGVMLGPRPT